MSSCRIHYHDDDDDVDRGYLLLGRRLKLKELQETILQHKTTMMAMIMVYFLLVLHPKSVEGTISVSVNGGKAQKKSNQKKQTTVPAAVVSDVLSSRTAEVLVDCELMRSFVTASSIFYYRLSV